MDEAILKKDEVLMKLDTFATQLLSESNFLNTKSSQQSLNFHDET